MEFLLFVVILAAMVFAIAVLLNADPWDVFDIRRHEWFREFRRDYHTSRQQFWSDLSLFRSFSQRNAPWLYACGFATLGLLLTGAVLVTNAPQSLRTGGRSQEPVIRSIDDEPLVALDTRTAPRAAATRQFDTSGADPRGDDWSVLVSIPPADRMYFAQPDPSAPAPATIIDPAVAFSEFAPEPPQPTPSPVELRPTRQPEAPVGLEIEITRLEPAVDLTEEFRVESVPVVDIAEPLDRIRDDLWVPAEEGRTRPPERPVLFEQRHGSVLLSRHDQTADDQARLIRIRPRAAGGAASPGVRVSSSMPSRAVAGRETNYEIEISNPGTDPLEGLILEEVLPADWKLITTTPLCVPQANNTLRWDIDDLAGGESIRLQVRVLVGDAETGRTRTIVTSGAAVESIVDISGDSPERDLEREPLSLPPQSDSAAGGWEASQPAGFEPLSPAPAATFGQAGLELDLSVPTNPRLGDTEFTFTVRNTGPVTISDAKILVWLDEGLFHARGRRIARPVPQITPGESVVLTLKVDARQAGPSLSRIELRSGKTVFDRTSARLNIDREPVSEGSGWQGRQAK